MQPASSLPCSHNPHNSPQANSEQSVPHPSTQFPHTYVHVFQEFSLNFFFDQSFYEYPICLILLYLIIQSIISVRYESYLPGLFYGLTIMCSRITNNIFKMSCKVWDRVLFILRFNFYKLQNIEQDRN